MTLSENLFLGFDLSTQQLKIISTFTNLKHHSTYRVDFDSELGSKYGIKKGVISIEETGEIYAPVEMWVEALDLCFTKMLEDGFPFDKVVGMSGSCQQHGSVYWSKEAPKIFESLNSNVSLKDQLCPNAFTFQTSPNWQDHSTGPELEIFEESVGGCHELAKITGSRAHYRFTGPQIRKLATRVDPVKYEETFRISLISSFLSSLLCTKITNIEESDGCGMNLYDIENSKFDETLLSVAAGVHPKFDNVKDSALAAEKVNQLKSKLGELEPVGSQSVGTIGNYFIEKYGFNSNCKIYSFTGDNLATILSLPLSNNDILISMGTSTTVLLVTDQYKPSENYHIFKHPTLDGHYMGMLCYCNGALAREKIRDKLNLNEDLSKEDLKSWDKFNSILDSSKPLNDNSEIGIYFPIGEIIPNAKPCERRFIYENEELKELKNEEDLKKIGWGIEQDVNAIIESQALSCRLRAGPMLESNNNDEVDGDVKFTENEEKLLQKLHKYSSVIKSDGTVQSDRALLARPNNVFFVGGSSKNYSIVNKYCSILGATNGNYKIDLSDACALGGCYKSLWSFLKNEDSELEDYGTWLTK
uniref:Xylulose kinase n=1 Tax=[Candida] sonorensis TaxID=51926 RepID=A0A0A8KA47_9ASCO|nr:xylulokinase [[Candida] sonorensis]